MRYIELQEAFEIEINKLDDGLTKPKSTDTEWWLNRGLEKFYKTRYSGLNSKQKGFEQNQKRIDDLRTLVKVEKFTEINKISNSEYSVNIPEDYLILLGDRVGIQPSDGITIDCWSKIDDNYVIKYGDTIEATIENIDRQISNSLSEYHLKYAYARPLKLIQNDNILLITDGKYKISEYIMTYLRKPIKIDLHKDPMAQYTDMPEHTHSEIVKLAAQMYLENQKDERYTSFSNEVNTME